MKPQKFSVIISAIAACICIAVLVAYIATFRLASISVVPANWGAFGDYVGGLLNPAFAALNLGAVIYIAFAIHNLQHKSEESRRKLDDERRLRDKETDKRILSLSLTSEFWSPTMKPHSDRIWQHRREIVPESPTQTEHSALGFFYRDNDIDDSLLLHSLMLVLAFYQKMWVYAESGELNQRICREQFGAQFKRFYDHFVTKGLAVISDDDRREGWDGGKTKLDELHRWLGL